MLVTDKSAESNVLKKTKKQQMKQWVKNLKQGNSQIELTLRWMKNLTKHFKWASFTWLINLSRLLLECYTTINHKADEK